MVAVYFGILFPIVALYVGTIWVSAVSAAPMPELHAAVPVLLDLIKVIVGGAIGAFSVRIGGHGGAV
jgi:hypothetical protein